MGKMPGDAERCPGPDTCLAGRARLIHSRILTKLELNKEPSRRQAAGRVHTGAGSAASFGEGPVVREAQSQVPPPGTQLCPAFSGCAAGTQDCLLGTRLPQQCPLPAEAAFPLDVPWPPPPSRGLCTGFAFSFSAPHSAAAQPAGPPFPPAPALFLPGALTRVAEILRAPLPVLSLSPLCLCEVGVSIFCFLAPSTEPRLEQAPNEKNAE